MKVTKFPIEKRSSKPVPEVIEGIERLLAKAKTGEVKNIAYACEYSGGDGGSGVEWGGYGAYSSSKLVGGVQLLLSELSHNSLRKLGRIP